MSVVWLVGRLVGCLADRSVAWLAGDKKRDKAGGGPSLIGLLASVNIKQQNLTGGG